MRLRKGIKVEADEPGTGAVATRGRTVTVRSSIRLNRGDVAMPPTLTTFRVRRREVFAGLDYSVEGMAVGGRRRVRVSPHLGYREKGVHDTIPADAVLIVEVELLEVRDPESGSEAGSTDEEAE
jgi:FKBP-type peptidyl-prolyl cis-trans isomerase